VFVALFLLLRLKFLRIYQPKSSFDLINNEKKPEPLPSGLWQWFIPLLKKSDNFIIRQAGLDGYFFVRYLALISMISFCALLVLFPILLPINSINGSGETGLNRFTYANVGARPKYYAHAILSLFFYAALIYVIYREMIYYTSMRQAALSTPRYGKQLSSRVVLFQTVPEQYLHESEFYKLFEGVKKVWIARGAVSIDDKVKERDNLANKLEVAENKLLKTAVKYKLKKEKKGEAVDLEELETFLAKKRPTHRLKFLIGEKVDTIDYAREKLPQLNKEVHELQHNHKEAKPMNSVFVEFDSQYSAQVAFQVVSNHTALHMSPRYVGIDASDIIWVNLRMFWWERLVRGYASTAAIIALLIFWSIPVAFVGLISNLTYLTNKLPWLEFIYNLPDALLGIITSLLPTVMLAALMALLPIFIRLMAKLSGSPSLQHVEHFTQSAYFAFLVFQVFLVTTISSSAASTVTQIIEDPTSVLDILSGNLPLASNFYVSYIILQGLTLSSGALAQVVPLIVFYLLGNILDGTPRKKWRRFTGLGKVQWGTLFPVFTNLAVITITYAIISPFVLLFASVSFFLTYVAYLYNLTYVFQEGPDSRGQHYPTALFQTLTGAYLGQICLLGLFAVSKAWGPLAIEAVGLGLTVFGHISLRNAYLGLLDVVPIDTMKPLDGKSETPSFNPSGKRVSYKKLVKDSEAFGDRDSLRSNSVELADLSELAIDRTHFGSNVPLLADGDESLIPPAPIWKRFFQPHIYSSYKVAKTRMPDIYQFTSPDEITDPELIEHAYDYPAVSSRTPYLWIPRDPFGLSTREIESFKGVIDISDEAAFFNEKGHIEWRDSPPSYDEDAAKHADKDDSDSSN
jgi:hypothetical protein